MAKYMKCWECGESGTTADPLVDCPKHGGDDHLIHKSELTKHIADNLCKQDNKPKKASNPNSAFNAPYTPSKALAAVIGPEPRAKSKMTQDIWIYFKANNCQVPEDKRKINADKKLQPVFDAFEKGRKQITLFEVGKVLGANSTKTEVKKA